MATPSILDHLFNQLCPGYSKEPHAALNHIRQTYNDATGNTILTLVFDYYTQILAASRPFIDQEVLPVSICQAFMDGLDSRLLAGFCTHFPNYSQSQERTATHQRKILQEMLQAAIRAKTEYTNIRTIASEAIGTGQAFSAQVNASQAEKTIAHYKSGDDASNKSGSTASRPLLHCYGYGGPHPWSTLKNGIYVIKCPNAGNPGIHENAKKTIEPIRNKQKKKQQDSQKRKNLATTNYSDFNDTSKERIWQQVLQSISTASNAASVSSSITGATGGTSTASAGAGRGRGKPIIFPMLTAQLSLSPSKVECHTSLSSSALSSTTAGAQAFDVYWTPQQLSAPETIISLLLLLSGTPTVLPKSSFLRIIHPLFSWELYKIMHTLSPLIYPWHSSFTCHISPEMEKQPLLSLPLGPK